MIGKKNIYQFFDFLSIKQILKFEDSKNDKKLSIDFNKDGNIITMSFNGFKEKWNLEKDTLKVEIGKPFTIKENDFMLEKEIDDLRKEIKEKLDMKLIGNDILDPLVITH